MSREEARVELAQLISSACHKERITKQDLARIALAATQYLEDFELTWVIGPARTAFMSYMPPYIVMLECYEKQNKKMGADLTIHLRYAIVKIKTEENEVVSTTITFTGDIE